MTNPYDDLPKTPANFVPLTPLSFLVRTVDIHPQRDALIYGDRRYTWGDVGDRATRLASALTNLGVGIGDTVSVMCPNTPELFEAHFAIPMAGGVLNAINTRLDVDTVAYILDHSDAKVLISDTAFSETVSAALANVDRDITIIDIVDPAGPGGDRLGAQTYDELLAKGDPNFAWSMPDDEWQAHALNYTSGSTGTPKGVVYHHRGSYLMSMGTVAGWGLGTPPTYLYTVPMFHCNGWGHAWTMALLGGTVVCIRDITAKGVFDAIADHGVTHFGGAPIILGMLVNAADDERRDFDHVVHAMTAGAPPPAAILKAVEQIGFDVMQVYGLTETLGHVSQCEWRAEWDDLDDDGRADKKSWQGVTMPMNEQLAVFDSETMTMVPRDGETQGEIFMRGNTVMKGYYKDPEATEKAFDGGWFHSGDGAVWRDNGYVQIKDRLKDVIISGGENVSSVEVENTLYKHPAVLAAGVVARPDEKWGEVPMAFIELKPGASATEEEITAFCREQLAGFKTPKAVVFGELPKTSTGKIQKFILRERARG
ncbi:MAG: fatty-acyl-CoA synthase [Verrucomicrobiales bacterium]